MAALALPWFVLITTGSPGRMGAVTAAEYAGIAVCGIPSGQLAARLGPRATIVVSDLVRAALVALIPALYWANLLALPWLLVIAFGVGAFFPAYSSSLWQAMARIVGQDESRLTRVGGLFGAVDELASFAGPALGGVLVLALGPAPVLLLDAVSFLLPLLAVTAAIPPTPRPAPLVTPQPQLQPHPVAQAHESPLPQSPPQGITSGLRWLARDRPLARRVLGAAVQNLGWAAMMATLPVLALTRFHGGAVLAGWLIASYGAGSVLGGLAVAKLKALTDRASVIAACGFAAVAWLLPAADQPWIVAAAIALGGVCFGVFYARFFAALAVRTPEAVSTQVMTAVHTVLSATGPIGFAGAGQLLQHTHSDTTISLLLVAAVASVGALIIAGSSADTHSPSVSPNG